MCLFSAYMLIKHIRSVPHERIKLKLGHLHHVVYSQSLSDKAASSAGSSSCGSGFSLSAELTEENFPDMLHLHNRLTTLTLSCSLQLLSSQKVSTTTTTGQGHA